MKTNLKKRKKNDFENRKSEELGKPSFFIATSNAPQNGENILHTNTLIWYNHI
ncbi:hypothetical protein EAL2_c13000 [Peptoclostridium acidaminophilum DSM 3953]|uniref:Uncharacterized protein n=1 Tax=Peptoclostridium acidaminophilum DSM 3953 TaxID=1286171 RepID=W8T6T9_PEPAC|nr:hypothetical protein EAL2_c13000 [Peptoclostridium acidaminophilum DSM 3953]